MNDTSAKFGAASSELGETLHALNHRYLLAWNRAERLQDELDHIRKSRAYRFACWLRSLTEWVRKPHVPLHSPPPIAAFQSEILDDDRAPATGTVTILIPFKDHYDLLRNCVRSLRRGTYRHVEILLLDNGSTCPRVLRYLHRGQARSRFRVVSCPGPFNFARICNVGAEHAESDFLLFLNNDTEALTPDWLERLLELGNRDDVGITGATLHYPDRTLQHAGVFPNATGGWTHLYRGLPGDHPGEFNELTHVRTVPAVTGACLLIRRDLFHEIGGFNEAYPLTFNDIDLCLRVRRRGLKVAITPHARLWHFESLSRGYARESVSLS